MVTLYTVWGYYSEHGGDSTAYFTGTKWECERYIDKLHDAFPDLVLTIEVN